MEQRTTLKSIFSPKDMTVGAPWKKMVEFAAPMLLGNIAQQLYSTVDSIIVGKYIGDLALSAVGSASPILNLMLALFVGISTGAGILVSQHFGAKNRPALSKTIGNCLTLTLLATLIVAVLGTLLAMPMLRLLRTPPAIIEWAAQYLRIFFIGCGGFMFYNILAGILRGLGDSISALLFLLISTALNVVGDLLLVKSMGVGGVALATVASQLISAIICFIKLARMRQDFDIRPSEFKLDSFVVKRIIKLGLPSGMMQAIFSLAMLVVQPLTNSFGETVIACNVVVMRVDGFAMLPNMTFGVTMATYTGQNYGAGRYDRIKSGAKQGTLLALGTSAFVTALILIFGESLMMLFTDTEELIGLSLQMLKILAFGYIAVSISQSLAGVMRGTGNTALPMWISLISTVIIRVPTAYLIAYLTRSEQYPKGMPHSTFFSLLISWSIGCLIYVLVYLFGKWRKKLESTVPITE